MQAIILAAGMGNRLGKYTKDHTKCMISINGRRLIERALDALDSAGIRKCCIVVGYQKENLMNFLGEHYKGMDICYISNDVYYKTNNIYSLYLAKDCLVEDDTLLLESDLIFEDRLIADILSSPDPILAAVARYEAWMDGTVVQLAQDNVIAAFIPKKYFDYAEKETYYKTVNIYKFSREFLRDVYVPFLEAYSHAMGNNEYYEQVLRVILTLDKPTIKAFILTSHKWYKIDDVQDKNIAEIIFSNTPGERLKRIEESGGGYWRYPELLDFCYAINPYFPTSPMMNEMKASFSNLIASYPSGLAIQNMLAAKLFSLEETNILTGNDTEELVNALIRSLSGGIGVVYPTFTEYSDGFTDNQIIPFIPADLTYTKDDLSAFSKKCDHLILINPDNPSGNYIPSKDIISIATLLKSRNKILILDESFIDFSDEEGASLLRQEILDAYPNLVIIKSLNRCYGISGIRLGVLASGNTALIRDIRSRLSIGNINSCAEYFLQIIGKYQKDYHISCRKIVAERERFRNQLVKTGMLEVYPSQGNYFMCRLTGNETAPGLTEGLLDRHNLFIKDLTGKKGIPGRSHIGIAIRNRADNDILIRTLFDQKRYIEEINSI